MPVDPAVGSTIQAAIFSAPKFVAIRSKSFANSAPSFRLTSNVFYVLVDEYVSYVRTPGIKTLAKVFTLLTMPPTEVAPIFIP